MRTPAYNPARYSCFCAAQRAFNLCLFLYMFCALWGYGAVFGQSLATYAPVPFLGEEGAYRLYVVLFSLIVVPMSTLNIKEQAAFQASNLGRKSWKHGRCR